MHNSFKKFFDEKTIQFFDSINYQKVMFFAKNLNEFFKLIKYNFPNNKYKIINTYSYEYKYKCITNCIISFFLLI